MLPTSRLLNPATKMARPIKTAILFQAAPAPSFGGVSKPYKPSGYRDSGADVGFGLKSLPKEAGIELVTPVDNPDPTVDADWSFPDTAEGISQALAKGANTLWANTVLFRAHPLFHLPTSALPSNVSTKDLYFYQQMPNHFEDYDEKTKINDMLREHGLRDFFPKAWAWDLGNEVPEGAPLPCVLKPVRGRGSHGVAVVHTAEERQKVADELFAEGSTILIEEFLGGEETTMSVMPPGDYDAPIGKQTKHWSLPVVMRFNHVNSVAPYSGAIPVSVNSRAVTAEEFAADPRYQELSDNAAKAGDLMQTRALMRIDCRRFSDGGKFGMFDVNMKPNITGPGRPGREDQIALTAMAGEPLGWDYPTFLKNMLKTRVPLEEGIKAASASSWEWEK